MHDAELAQLAHLNNVEAFALLSRHQPTGFVQRSGGVVVAATGSPIAFFNEILPVDDHVQATALIDAVRTLRGARLAFGAHLREGVDDPLLPVVNDLGLEENRDGALPAMVLTDMPTALRVLPVFRVVRVVDQATFDDHLRTAAANAGAGPELAASWLGPGVVDDPAAALFVGYADGKPVATSISVRTGDVIGIYNVNTIESARRRGYGWAMTLAAATVGAQAGCSIATLQSSAMGLPMYEAHGFRTVFRYRYFQDPTRISRTS